MKTTSCIAFAFALAFSTFAMAAPEKPSAKAETAAKTEKRAVKKDTYPLYGQVVSINTRTLVIKGGEGKEDRKFTLSAATEIAKEGKPAKVEDVKVGQWVGGFVAKSETGNDKLLKLNLSAKQKADKPAAKDTGKSEAAKGKA